MPEEHKLFERIADAVAKRRAEGASYKDLCEEFDCSRGTIGRALEVAGQLGEPAGPPDAEPTEPVKMAWGVKIL